MVDAVSNLAGWVEALRDPTYKCLAKAGRAGLAGAAGRSERDGAFDEPERTLPLAPPARSGVLGYMRNSCTPALGAGARVRAIFVDGLIPRQAL